MASIAEIPELFAFMCDKVALKKLSKETRENTSVRIFF